MRVDILLALQSNGSNVFLKARDCMNKEVGEGCPGEGSQLQVRQPAPGLPRKKLSRVGNLNSSLLEKVSKSGGWDSQL